MSALLTRALEDLPQCAGQLDRDGGSGRATLVIRHAACLTKRATTALAAEGRRLLRFVAAHADGHDVHYAAVD